MSVDMKSGCNERRLNLMADLLHMHSIATLLAVSTAQSHVAVNCWVQMEDCASQCNHVDNR